jgi:hypothetical protein
MMKKIGIELTGVVSGKGELHYNHALTKLLDRRCYQQRFKIL